MKHIGKTVRFILLSLLVPTLCVTTAWADVSDPCDSLFGPGSYQNLAPSDQDYIRWNNPPDSSYLCQQSNRRAASVVYRCSDAREVTVAIYSRHGCYAGYQGDQLVRGGDQLPLWYQDSTGEVYCDGRRMVYDAQLREFVFLEEEGNPSGLVEYGLSVYCSGDGSDYQRVPIRLVSAWRERPDSYWYEVYRADLEEGTRYLRLDLTDQSSIEIPGREERYQFEAVGGLSLASVEIIEEEASQEEDQKSDEDDEDDSWYGDNWDDDDWDDWYDWENWYNWEDWEDWEIWEEGELESFQTAGLPSYQPGEEQGPEWLPWGPDEDPADGGPAFPEEIGDREEEREDEREPEGAAPGDGSSSSGGGSSASPKSQSQQKGSPDREGQSEAPQETSGDLVRTGGTTPTLRREVPLWRRVMEPDAMSMMIIAFTLLVMGIRILWDSSGNHQNYYRKSEEETRREERYARYTSYARDAHDPRDIRDPWDVRDPREDPEDWEDR